ncbi:MAG TPA: serine hydrolase domain-containing protein [Actinophytocola sp.]|uniref:serine hydrolase domain-containing protein n=1 Tax=Actinophytocola sp. TaxID=1872138 RepID=UPI002DDCEB51|nr:serine hydrolase domain-containing protein [Actinophytocola sp.]HEV2779264.1 serine hydrolase domain-containing protein [Actinophytocola sp.]
MDRVDLALTRLREPEYAHVEHLVVVDDGAVVAAHRLADRGLGEPGEVHSVTKSVLATVVLLAVRDGRLALDSTLGGLLGARVPRPRRVARVRDLLAMTGGALCAGLDDIDRVMELPSGWVAALLAQPQRDPPGERFCYDNGAVHLLAAAVLAAAGDPAQLAADRIFAPLGIRDWEWPRDPEGIPLGYGGLRLSALD